MDITPYEILNLISSEVGHSLVLRSPSTVTQPQVEYGIPAGRQITQKTLVGYVVPERPREIVVTAQPIKSGNWIAYIAGSSLDRTDITPEGNIEWEGQTYSIEYIQGIYHASTIILHKLRLVTTQASTHT